ncbi:lytic polysaccharide monooxygenase [Aaosphaeria arxii CBS 175.79]|uniref:lytic cellulose monooxygenase (C4-dehydrogenating) n=1 Tax=Aaosphaeria arxii CBS 175.79 TaxID=1450172 RepID=A0A6A5X813_9PLEO|nr:lytic polysaccharide monooxygenase [Aaosphaeria arxii CBS 175.79]KAF2008894.1 lytic polysaccharide monooxygenase [Aaosphaeria arxii CBS 175.79]
MKYAIILLVALVFRQSQAHYLTGRLIFDNHWTDTWEYVRKISPYDGPLSDPNLALVYPNTDPASLDLRCGRNATKNWSTTKTAVLKAGDKVGFGAGAPTISLDKIARIYHPGFGSVWMSKSPHDDVDRYEGDGDWFKILQIVGRTEQSLDFEDPGNKNLYDRYKAMWGTFNVQSWNFTIPATTPPGKYLLRFEHVFPNTYDSQFYVNCAHIEVVNPGVVGTPSPLVKIPGIYERGQPDVYFDHYNSSFIEHPEDISWFIPPQPNVWKG